MEIQRRAVCAQPARGTQEARSNISCYHCYYLSSKACSSIPFFEEVVTPFWVPTTACLHGMGQAAHTVQWLADSAPDFSLSWGLHKARPLVDTLEQG